jgi:hypothetical protein
MELVYVLLQTMLVAVVLIIVIVTVTDIGMFW